MSNETKVVVLKTLIIIGIVLLIMLFPGSIIISLIVSDQKTFTTIFNTLLFSFFGVGILLMILLPIFGGLKPKPVKAEKVSLPFTSYDELFAFLQERLLEKDFRLQKTVSILANEEATLYLKALKKCQLTCFVIIRAPELSDEMLDTTNDGITDMLNEYYGSKAITDTVVMTSIFCVDRITPAFKKLLNSNLQQGLKNNRLIVGISFGGKNLYIARQKDGFAVAKYKRLRREFINIMDLQKGR